MGELAPTGGLHVLPAMVDTRAAHTEAHERGSRAHARHVHGALPDRLLPRAEALRHLQPALPRGRLPHMLQRPRQLPVLGQPVRLGALRLCRLMILSSPRHRRL